MFGSYLEAADFPGTDIVQKFLLLQMGYSGARETRIIRTVQFPYHSWHYRVAQLTVTTPNPHRLLELPGAISPARIGNVWHPQDIRAVFF
ncbi:MAG: hypothetical protein H0X43_12685 [Nitrosospira sp.]|nr:hypothetical protein [Nitrosospira sp.]